MRHYFLMSWGKVLTQAEFQFAELVSHIPFIKICINMNVRFCMNEANNLSEPGRDDSIGVSQGENSICD